MILTYPILYDNLFVLSEKLLELSRARAIRCEKHRIVARISDSLRIIAKNVESPQAQATASYCKLSRIRPRVERTLENSFNGCRRCKAKYRPNLSGKRTEMISSSAEPANSARPARSAEPANSARPVRSANFAKSAKSE